MHHEARRGSGAWRNLTRRGQWRRGAGRAGRGRPRHGAGGTGPGQGSGAWHAAAFREEPPPEGAPRPYRSRAAVPRGLAAAAGRPRLPSRDPRGPARDVAWAAGGRHGARSRGGPSRAAGLDTGADRPPQETPCSDTALLVLSGNAATSILTLARNLAHRAAHPGRRLRHRLHARAGRRGDRDGLGARAPAADRPGPRRRRPAPASGAAGLPGAPGLPVRGGPLPPRGPDRRVHEGPRGDLGLPRDGAAADPGRARPLRRLPHEPPHGVRADGARVGVVPAACRWPRSGRWPVARRLAGHAGGDPLQAVLSAIAVAPGRREALPAGPRPRADGPVAPASAGRSCQQRAAVRRLQRRPGARRPGARHGRARRSSRWA